MQFGHLHEANSKLVLGLGERGRPILPPPRAIPYPTPTIPKPDLPEKTLDPGLKTGYSFTLLFL